MSVSLHLPAPPVLACCESCGRARPLLALNVDAEVFAVCSDCLPPAVTPTPPSAPTE